MKKQWQNHGELPSPRATQLSDCRSTSHLFSFSPLATSFIFYLIVVWAHCTLVGIGTTLVKRRALCTFSLKITERGTYACSFWSLDGDEEQYRRRRENTGRGTDGETETGRLIT